MSSQDQEGVDMLGKQHKGLGSAPNHRLPDLACKPDGDEARVEVFSIGKQSSGKIEGQKSEGVKTTNIWH